MARRSSRKTSGSFASRVSTWSFASASARSLERGFQRVDLALHLRILLLPRLALLGQDVGQVPVPLRVDAEGRGERADLGLEPVVLVVGPLEDATRR